METCPICGQPLTAHGEGLGQVSENACLHVRDRAVTDAIAQTWLTRPAVIGSLQWSRVFQEKLAIEGYAIVVKQ